jgi:hypothetical protein
MPKYKLEDETKWLNEQLSQRQKFIETAGPENKVARQYKPEVKILSRIIEVLEKVTKQGIKREKKENASFAYWKDFLDAYSAFHYKWINTPAMLDPVQGAALKKIIAYLIEANNEKSEEGALKAWKYILYNWDKLSKFIQQQKSLLQIHRNLTEILDQLRNGHNKTNRGTNRLSDLERELNR